MYFTILRSFIFWGLSLSSTLHAAVTPFLSITLQPGATTDVFTSTTGTANYLVSLNHQVPSALTLSIIGGLPQGVSQVVENATCTPEAVTCTNPFSIEPGQSCCLELQFIGNNMAIGPNVIAPIIGTTPAFYNVQTASLVVNVSNIIPETTLSISPSTLALSVTGLTTDQGLNTSGTARTFTITNTGNFTAFDIACPTSNSPSIERIVCTGCDVLLAAATCTATITPTATPSAPIADTNPTPISLSFQGGNTNALTSTVNILTYGSFYQSGYLFSIIETVNFKASIGGAVVAETDATPYSPGLPWDSSSACGAGTCATTGAGSSADGLGNTIKIKNTLLTQPNNSYAAGICYYAPAVNGYGNWYLPAIDQMGSSLLSIQNNLIEPGTHTFNFTLPGTYWSSTEKTSSTAYVQNFVQNASGSLAIQNKSVSSGVRCARDLT